MSLVRSHTIAATTGELRGDKTVSATTASRAARLGPRARLRARFATEAKLARAARIAPIPISSGKTDRHRLDRGGNRQLNTAILRIALTRARCHPETQHYLARKRAEGKTGLEAMRCFKRHLTRRVWHLLQPPTPTRPSASRRARTGLSA